MRFADLPITEAAWAHCEHVLRPVLALAPTDFLGEVTDRVAEHGIQAAVAVRDNAAPFD